MDERDREIERLRAENAELKALVVKLLARIDELEAQLKQNSGNSSKPPSSDLGRKRKPPVEPSGRKQGGQPGHVGSTRKLVPLAEVDEVVDRDPELCEQCGASLEAAPRLDACVRQIYESPEFKAIIRQFNLWLKRCQSCGHSTRGQMPAGSPKGAFGPRLQAKIAFMSGRFRMTRREVRSLSEVLLGVPISLGSVQACCQAASEAVAETVQALHEEIKQAAVLYVDETGFGRCGKDRMWLWLAAGGDVEIFRLLPGRGGKQAADLLGKDFPGTLHRDRWRSYEQLDQADHQLCHSHIRRDFQSMLETLGETGVQGAMLKLASDQAFHHWHRFEREEIDRPTLIRETKPIQAEIKRRLQLLRAGPGISKKAKGTATDLLRQWDSLWTYLHQEGVEPTNNEAERSIRKAVLWRKMSLGVESEAGARFVERMLSLAGTARRRGIDLLDWLTQALRAKLEKRPAPVFQP
jgi:transposase